MKWTRVVSALPAVGLAGVASWDLTQKDHSLLRNFPVLGHARYAIELIGPELRQYIVASNDEERPFSRDQRSWIYKSSKGLNNYVGFGTDDNVEETFGYPVIKHRAFARSLAAETPEFDIPCAKVLGASHRRAKAFRPESVINISAMSFGSLSANAIKALNAGAGMVGSLHNTGEGGLSDHHRNGGDLIWQIGTGYFGCRDEQGNFDIEKLVATVESAPVKALEIKLSQGAKPGLGGVLPGHKVTPEIAKIRAVPEGQDVISPSRHTAFTDVPGLIDFVEQLADRTGLPVGIKSAVGEMSFWDELATQMATRGQGPDFITIDGGEGGTGAAPVVFSDAVALPWTLAFSRVYKIFAEAGLQDDVVFIGSGKLGLPRNAAQAFAMGVDMINVAREAMLSIGCLQTQKCHTDTCPVGIATQNKWLAHGLDPELKKVRAANYIIQLRHDLHKIISAVGVAHPALLTPTDIELMDGVHRGTPLSDVFSYQPGWGELRDDLADEITRLMEAGDTRSANQESDRAKPDSIAEDTDHGTISEKDTEKHS